MPQDSGHTSRAQKWIQLTSFFLLCGIGALASASDRWSGVLSSPPASRWVSVPALPRELAILPSVFWEPLDTVSLRELLRQRPEFVRGKSVLEIGTGSGLIALCCKEAGASKVLATDINPNAIQCARRNARRLQLDVELRLVPGIDGDADSSAFSVISPQDKFDLIVSNPPWEDAKPKDWSEFALYDPGMALLQSLLQGCRDHLKPGGRLLLAYGHVEAIRRVQQLADEFEMQVLILDDRDPENLPDSFLPGMLLGVMVE